jgi:peptide/nickel transport system substrate-binding protein
MFADKRLRRAMTLLIDRPGLIGKILHGLPMPTTCHFYYKSPECDPAQTPLPFDPVEGVRLLEEAGWKDRDGDGVVEDSGGRPFAFTIRTNQGNDERKKIAEILQQRFKDLGVKVEIQTIDWASFIKEFVKPRKFEAIVLGLGFGSDPDQYVLWHSSQTGPDQMNRTGYANPEVDALLEKGRASCRQEERVKYYHRIQEILAEDIPMIFLYVRDALPVIASRVRGPDPGPAGMLWNLPEWYVPKHLQVYTAG